MRFAYLAAFIFLFSCSDITVASKRPTQEPVREAIAGPLLGSQKVSQHGRLRVEGSHLVDYYGTPIQLKGMSSHGLQWFGKFANKSSMKELRDNWGQSVFRAAMYTEEGGYIQNRNLKYKVYEIANAAIELDSYVIIDWHILRDGNPMWHLNEAREFFAEMSKYYAGYQNVIYEIANEPNGNDVHWINAIRPYAEEIARTIRGNDSQAIIIVGTGSWSQDVHEAAANPLREKNIMYALHFYAASHGQFLRDRLAQAMSQGIAIFVTEWGTMDASGRGGMDVGSTRAWMDLLDKNKVGWCNWSLSDSNDSHAVLRPGANPNGGWGDRDLTPSGRLVRGYMLR